MTAPIKDKVISLRISAEDLAVIDAEAQRAGVDRTEHLVSRGKAPSAGEATRALKALEAIQRQLLDLVDIAETALDPPAKPRRKRSTQ